MIDVGVVGQDAEILQPLGQLRETQEGTERGFDAAQFSLPAVERPRHTQAAEFRIFNIGREVGDKAGHVAMEGAERNRTTAREVPFERCVVILRLDRLQIGVAARSIADAFGIVRIGVADRRRGADGQRRVEVAETGARPRFGEGKAKLQLGRQAQARADVRQEIVVRVRLRYWRDRGHAARRHAVEAIDFGFGSHRAQADEAVDRHAAEIEGVAALDIARISLFIAEIDAVERGDVGAVARKVAQEVQIAHDAVGRRGQEDARDRHLVAAKARRDGAIFKRQDRIELTCGRVAAFRIIGEVEVAAVEADTGLDVGDARRTHPVIEVEPPLPVTAVVALAILAKAHHAIARGVVDGEIVDDDGTAAGADIGIEIIGARRLRHDE